MPELPDVEVFRRVVHTHALGKRIQKVRLDTDGLLEGVSARALRSALEGHRLAGTKRHGKHLFVQVVNGKERWLRLHFGMTGNVAHYRDGDEEPHHVRLRLDFAGGEHLAHSDVRKLGAIGLVDDPEEFVRHKRLGPDPLEDDVDPAVLRERLDGRSGTLKGALMNQEVLAGLGNIYVDEVLFQAKLHPTSSAEALEEGDVRRLSGSIRRVVERAIEAGADVHRMPRTWLLPHRDAGSRCPRCGGRIERIRVGGRSTFFCGRHQERRG